MHDSIDMLYSTTVRKFVRAYDRHLAKCRAGQPSIPPSKGRKGDAYSAGSKLARHRGLPIPNTLDDLRNLVS